MQVKSATAIAQDCMSLPSLTVVDLLTFYRATALCVSAVFAVVACPSVRLSATFVYCIQTAEDIVKLLSRPGSRNSNCLSFCSGT